MREGQGKVCRPAHQGKMKGWGAGQGRRLGRIGGSSRLAGTQADPGHWTATPAVVLIHVVWPSVKQANGIEAMDHFRDGHTTWTNTIPVGAVAVADTRVLSRHAAQA